MEAGVKYVDFKAETIKAANAAIKAESMFLISHEVREGFCIAMREAREIFMRLESKETTDDTKE